MSRGFQKIWYFSKFESFKPELLLLKVGSNLNFFLAEWRRPKKKTRLPMYSELDVKAVLFSYFRNQKSTVRNGKTENDFLEVTLAAEDGNFC